MTGQPPDVPGGPHLRTVAMPRDANPSGDIFGGWTVSQMDLAGAIFAANHTGGRVATMSIETMQFLRPVTVGDEVSCYCNPGQGGGDLAYRSHRDLVTRAGRQDEKVTEGTFTFVALDESGKPRPASGS